MLLESSLLLKIAAWVAISSVKGMVLTITVIFLRRLLAPVIASAWRHALWLPVLACLLCPLGRSVSFAPVLNASLPAWLAALPPTPTKAASRSADGASDPRSNRLAAPPASTAPNAERPGAGELLTVVAWWLTLIWVAGAAVLALIYLYNLLKFQRLRLAGHRVDGNAGNILERCKVELGMTHTVRLLESCHIGSPTVVGWWRPTLLLPLGLHKRLDADRLRHVLLHELAHVKRNDVLFNWMGALAQLVHWFNPIVWLATRLMRSDMELACDASVLDHLAGGERREYGEMLVHMADSCGGQTVAPYALGVADRISDLRGRLIMIAGFRIASIRNKCGTMLAIVAVTSVALIQLSFTPPARAQAQTPASTGSTPGEQSSAQLLLEQTRPQKEVPFNPSDFDKFVGYYKDDTFLGLYARVYRTGDHYYLQLTGQGSVEFFPESSTEFFATVVAAQISFVTSRDGQVTGMTIHQNGFLRPWTKISKSAYDEGNAELKRRVSSNIPSQGTQDSLRRWIGAMENGRPNYEEMSPGLAAAAREQWPRTKLIVQKLGAFRALTFERVAPNGDDIYAATFAHGTAEMVIGPLSADGKVIARWWHVSP